MNKDNLTSHKLISEQIKSLYETDEKEDFLTLLFANKPAAFYSYKIVIELAYAWTSTYLAASLKADQRVVIILPHGINLYTSFIGCLLGNFIPSIFAHPSEKLSSERYLESIYALIQQASPSLIVTYPAIEELLLEHDKTQTLPTIIVRQPNDPLPKQAVIFPELRDPNKAAFLQFSSGTTGLKKGTLISNYALTWQIEAYQKRLAMTASDRIISWLPLYHDMGLIACFFLPLLTATPLIAQSAFDWVKNPVSLLTAISSYQATLCWLPNFAYNFLSRNTPAELDPELDLSSIRAFINCSESILANSHDVFLKRFGRHGVSRKNLATCYAMAETTFAVSNSKLGEPVFCEKVHAETVKEGLYAKPIAAQLEPTLDLVSSGELLSETEVRIVSEQGATLTERHIGEIVIKMPSLFGGYLNNPEASKASLINGWYHSGDLGYLVENTLFVIGRKKELIIIAGKNIFPQDVEIIINNCEGVIKGRCVAMGRNNNALGTQQLIVLVESHLEDAESQMALKQVVRTAIQAQLDVVVSDIRILPHQWLLKSTSGKLSRGLNLKKYLCDFSSEIMRQPETESYSSTAKNAEQHAIEKKIIACAKRQLQQEDIQGISDVNINTKLFTSGLFDSLAITQFLLALEKIFSVVLPAEKVADLSAINSPVALAKLIKGLLNVIDRGLADKPLWQTALNKQFGVGTGLKYQLWTDIADAEKLTYEKKLGIARLSQANFRSPTINTDKIGLRQCYYQDTLLTLDVFNKLTGKTGAVLGNSVAFGVGASGDQTTLGGQLEKHLPEIAWYNFALRMSSLREELAVFEKTCHRQIDHMIWLSGQSEMLNFFNELLKQMREAIYASNDLDELLFSNVFWNENITAWFDEIDQMAKRFKEISAARGAMPLFFFQANLSCINKLLTAEESALLRIYDRNFHIQIRQLRAPNIFVPFYEYVIERFSSCFREQGITFINLNEQQAFCSDKWLFLDRVHLNDQGLAIIAAIAARSIKEFCHHD